ncbi:MAG TPA: branched-chain amino acid ABC transporter permease [Anaeromyxobacteraceae bacterium]|nr:branched-chain amino acid ABC transporter permease [Anaeromyxobacteraceae bacterium]
MSPSRARAAAWFLLLAALCALPLVATKFATYLAMRVMMLGIFALGYNLLLGRTGLLSFGHGAFYAAGAYGLGLFALRVSPHPIVGLAVGVAAAAFLSLLVGWFSVRSSEVYFAMLTLAFGMMFFALVWNARDITGGDDGLIGVMRAPIDLGPVRLPIARDTHFYFLVLLCFAGTVWLVHRVRASPFGLVLAGIRENAVRVEFTGVDVRRYRLGVFVLSAALAGLAGGLEVLLESGARPFMAHWTHSAEPILVSLLGGLHSLAGPLVGSLLFVAMRELIQRFTQEWMLVFGLVLLVIIMGFRGGVVGSLAQLWRSRRAGREEA